MKGARSRAAAALPDGDWLCGEISRAHRGHSAEGAWPAELRFDNWFGNWRRRVMGDFYITV
jgi:hypothetical protein